MTLEIQIQSLSYSLMYGMFIVFIFNFIYRYLFHSNFIYKIIMDFLFVSDSVLLYFWLLKMINNGIFHSYFLIMFIVGGFISDRKTKIFRKMKK